MQQVVETELDGPNQTTSQSENRSWRTKDIFDFSITKKTFFATIMKKIAVWVVREKILNGPSLINAGWS